MADARINVAIGGDPTGFERAVGKAKGSASGFASSLSKIGGMVAGAFGAYKVIGFVKGQMDAADAIKDVARGLGMATNEVIALKQAGEQAGIPFERVQQLVSKLADAQQSALSSGPSSELAKSFERLGVSVQDLVSMAPTELMQRFAEAVRAGGVDVAALNDVMGAAAAVDFMDAFGDVGSIDAFSKAVTDAADAVDKLAATKSNLDLFFAEFNNTSLRVIGAVMEAFGMGGAGVSAGTKATDAKAARDRVKANQARVDAVDRAYWEKQDAAAAKSQEQMDETLKKNLAQEAKAKAAREARVEKAQVAERRDYSRQLDSITVEAPRAATNLGRLGMYTGAQDNVMRALAERQAKADELTQEHTRRMKEILEGE